MHGFRWWRHAIDVAVSVPRETGESTIRKRKFGRSSIGVARKRGSLVDGVSDALQEAAHVVGKSCCAAAGAASLCCRGEATLCVVSNVIRRKSAKLSLDRLPG